MIKKTPAKTALTEVLEKMLYKKTFQKISVHELCAAAGISRTAFYANFEDKYQLLSYCLSQKSILLEELMTTHTPEEFLTVMLDFIQKENRFFYHTFGAEPDEETRKILYDFFNFHFTKILQERVTSGRSLPGPMEVVSSFYIGGMTATGLLWIKSNYKQPKEELAACQYRLLKPIIE